MNMNMNINMNMMMMMMMMMTTTTTAAAAATTTTMMIIAGRVALLQWQTHLAGTWNDEQDTENQRINEVNIHKKCSTGYTYIGVRRSVVVKFAAIRLPGPRFKPRPGQKFETRFLGPQHWIPEPVPNLETHHQQSEGSIKWVQIVGRKKE